MLLLPRRADLCKVCNEMRETFVLCYLGDKHPRVVNVMMAFPIGMRLNKERFIHADLSVAVLGAV